MYKKFIKQPQSIKQQSSYEGLFRKSTLQNGHCTFYTHIIQFLIIRHNAIHLVAPIKGWFLTEFNNLS